MFTDHYRVSASHKAHESIGMAFLHWENVEQPSTTDQCIPVGSIGWILSHWKEPFRQIRLLCLLCNCLLASILWIWKKQEATLSWFHLRLITYSQFLRRTTMTASSLVWRMKHRHFCHANAGRLCNFLSHRWICIHRQWHRCPKSKSNSHVWFSCRSSWRQYWIPHHHLCHQRLWSG